MSAVETYAWSQAREEAIRAFGNQAPGAALEAEIMEVFETAPALVVSEIRSVGEVFKCGAIRSGWAVLRSRLAEPTGRAELVVVDGSERERVVARADQWLRTAGVHFDREDELLDELFDGYGGDRRPPLLRPWRADEELRRRMVALWRELRGEVAA